MGGIHIRAFLEGPHGAAEEQHKQEEAAEMKCHELTMTPMTCPL